MECDTGQHSISILSARWLLQAGDSYPNYKVKFYFQIDFIHTEEHFEFQTAG